MLNLIFKLTGAKHVVAVSNGTVALRLALHLLVQPRMRYCFLSNLFAVLMLLTISTLSFHDIELHFRIIHTLRDYLTSNTYIASGICYNKNTQRRIAAIIPVHIFGNPCYISQIVEVASEFGLPVVEDSTEALGSFVNSTHCGLFGDIGTLSFNGNKIITTGGGGALITNNDELAVLARHLSTTAMFLN